MQPEAWDVGYLWDVLEMVSEVQIVPAGHNLARTFADGSRPNGQMCRALFTG